MRKPKGGARPIGAFIAKALDPSARARGFALTALLSDWPAIAGAALARYTVPDRVIWPRRHDDEVAQPIRGHRSQGATLVLRIEGPRAIEVQHRSDQILERVNAYFGYRAITEMRFLPRTHWPKTARRSKTEAGPQGLHAAQIGRHPA